LVSRFLTFFKISSISSRFWLDFVFFTFFLESLMVASIFSFFAGAGFLDLGFERAGYKIEFVNEAYSPFLRGYHHARTSMNPKSNTPRYGHHLCSAEKFLDEQREELKAFVADAQKQGLVGFIGGPPCPDFSVAGKNAGGTGKHGNLSQVYVDIICHQQPDFFLFENVKGLVSNKAHKQFFNKLVAQLLSAGYACDWRLVNAIEYGAPQDRWRVILVGFKGVVKIHQFSWEASWSADKLFKIAQWPQMWDFEPNAEKACPAGVIECLTVEHWFRKNDVLNHPNGQDFLTPKSLKIWETLEGDVSKKSCKRLHRWRYSPTACYGNNEVHLHPYKARRLSVAEALAIQSLPKDFCLPAEMTLTAKFKTVGNGVPFLMARGIAESIAKFLQ
jgi:DNA (cytosine-5)-methyltransferase 1